MSASLLFQPAPDAVYGFPNARRLVRVDSPHQHIEVWDTPQLGRLFTLDGRPMTSSGDEFIYHECMTQPAALTHPAPRAALVLGGGDGGAAKQLLAHRSIERIVVAELDAEVVRLTREHLPDVHGGALDDPRVELVIGDAAEYVARQIAGASHANRALFDLVVFDLTPPDSPAAGLYTPAFLTGLKRILAPTAAVSLHLGSPYFHAARVAALLENLRQIFAVVRPLAAYVPLYGSLWMMAIASDTLDAAALTAHELSARLAQRGLHALRFYDAATHAALFAAPHSVRDKLGRFLKPSR
ncbi:polyamine aminopropyltransferase [Paraburkholderia rhizosphaerae]|uniref:Polyamine aminopropyltransferase n=1 Tax=Paraburkholderia rhizosphaerae TaxID=480658 RepID=A0A4R8LU44_9BURK|nr:polyamine aminopropyltransferase [Paraburkholderia rhizosphaerae]TDY50305.1 spermidine synthase [Paraburkholderia rhizosphaerae]